MSYCTGLLSEHHPIIGQGQSIVALFETAANLNLLADVLVYSQLPDYLYKVYDEYISFNFILTKKGRSVQAKTETPPWSIFSNYDVSDDKK